MAGVAEEQPFSDKTKFDDDYYATLNVSRSATTEEITHAFRQLSRVYHPDKHRDPVLHRDAVQAFERVRHAYDVLSNPQQRAIYDTLGSEALQTSGWQISLRTKTPEEIREEYARLAKEQEIRHLEQQTSPRCYMSVGVDATDVFDRPTEDDAELDYGREGLPNVEFKNMIIRQTVEAPLSASNSIRLWGQITAENGRGAGSLSTGWRHIYSSTLWTELSASVGSAFGCSAKLFKTIDSKHYAALELSLRRRTRGGFYPNMMFTLARRLNQKTMAYVTWREGIEQSLATSIQWSSGSTQLLFSVQFGLLNTFAQVAYTYSLWNAVRLKCSASLGTASMSLMYGCETQLSTHNTLGASIKLGHPEGVVLEISLVRGNQTFICPIQLSQDVCPSAIFYGTLVPLVSYFALNKFVVQPYHARRKKEETEKLRNANKDLMAAQRKHAEASIALMKESYERKRRSEEVKAGLVIIDAIYGRTEHVIALRTTALDSRSRTPSDVIRVSIPLQVLSENSRLVLGDVSKSNLPGFYDPCIGEEKILYVKYMFRNQLYEVTVGDAEALRIPMERHLMRSPGSQESS